MNRPLQQLRTDANRILALLDQGFPFSAGQEERSSLIDETGRLLHKLDAIDQDYLSIGLLGGTGVGKSSIMNALAGSEIASAGHRRPFTHQVLVYRHKEAGTLPSLGRSDLEWQEILHEIDPIRQVLLCDLPDFDSLAAEHRERVGRFLDHLDLAVWVTSLEKYGDNRFYEFLDTVPKARPNFLFVLNKVDLLFHEDEVGEAYERLARTVDLFRKHLAEHGVDDPILFAVSAQEVLAHGPATPWNQFPIFKRQVFQQREIKEIHRIRSANLDVELRGVASVLERESLPLQSVERIIDSALMQMEAHKPVWSEDAREAISRWMRKHWESILLEGEAGAALIGPGHAIELLFAELRRIVKRGEPLQHESPSHNTPDRVPSFFRAQVEEARDGITRQMLVQGLPAPLLERAESVLNRSGRVEAFERRMAEAMSELLRKRSTFSFRGFKAMQILTYAALFVLLLVAIGGRETWEGVIAEPGWKAGLRLLLSWFSTLFSTQGLAALGSYLLINLYLGFRFFRRRKKVVERVAERAVRKNSSALLEVWENELTLFREDLKGFQEDIRSKISFLKGE